MSGDGSLTHTYVAALQHDLVDLEPGTTRLGVVRRPTPWFYGAVDDNEPALGPPDPLLDEIQARQEELKARGICDAEATNVAWEELEVERRYRHHLATDAAARAAVESVLERLGDGESIALVCYENTENKRCHRTVLLEHLADRR